MTRNFLLLSIVILLLAGCSKTSNINPVAPGEVMNPAPQISQDTHNNRYLWGLWDVIIDHETLTAEIVPVRNAGMHFNVVKLLEDAPCQTCLRIEEIDIKNGNELFARLLIKHPLAPNLTFCAFDVRGIFITEGDYSFPVSNRLIAWDDTNWRVINPDGYTALFNPPEFPTSTTIPYVLTYYQGKCATSYFLNSTLNAYWAFATGADRRLFGAGDPWTQRVIWIKVPSDQAITQFGYAIDASWFPAENVQNPWVDFPPEANCLEPYDIQCSMSGELIPGTYSEADVLIDIYDHQGFETIESVTVESPDLFSGEIELTYDQALLDGGYRFTGALTNENLADLGEYPALVKVTDTQSDPNHGAVYGYDIFSITIERGWAQTWGGILKDNAKTVETDLNGYIYVGGEFSGSVDFDPEGFGNVLDGTSGVYLSKFTKLGEYLWTRTWGTELNTSAFINGMDFDSDGNLYVVGSFDGTVDFDPGPLIEQRTGTQDAYMMKLDSSGNLNWVMAWGSYGQDYAFDVMAIGNLSVYVTGAFSNIVDFDPSYEVHMIGSAGGGDVYISKFQQDGNYSYTRAFGGSGLYDMGTGLAWDQVENEVLLTGTFSEILDFDTRDGPSDKFTPTPFGGQDCFLSSFDAGLIWQSTNIWGGSLDESAHDIYCSDEGKTAICGETWSSGPLTVNTFLRTNFSSSGPELVWGTSDYGLPVQYDPFSSVSIDDLGNIFIGGCFTGTVDFDPAGSGAFLTSNGGWDGYISKFDPEGQYLWTTTSGGTADDRVRDIATTESGSVIGAGLFMGSVDFDPGISSDTHNSNGDTDAFIVRYNSDGGW